MRSDMPNPPPPPADLPRPMDDGAAAHLEGMQLPQITLRSTEGETVDLAQFGGRNLVLYVFPKMGRPGEADPAGWQDTPGAYGCTQQSCAFRDRQQLFQELGYSVAGLSAQEHVDQLEAVQRLHLEFPLLADPERRVDEAMNLPTLRIAGMTLYKRLTAVVNERRIVKVFYPVFPPNENAAEVLAWLREHSA